MSKLDRSNVVESEVCKFCGSAQFHVITEGYGFDDPSEKYRLIACSGCELVRTDPFPAAQELARHYSSVYYGDGRQKFGGPFELVVKVANVLRAREFIGQLAPSARKSGARILDVGCGRADFLRALSRQGYTCFGSEIPSFAFPESKSASDRRITFLHGQVEDVDLEEETFDGISIWHVLEHVENPFSAIERCARLLKPGGVLGVAVPNYGSLQARIFGPHWFPLDLPRHLHHFTFETLTRIFGRVGLKTFRTRTTSPVQNTFGVIQSSLNAVFTGSSNQLYRVMKGGAGGGVQQLLSPSGMASVGLGVALLPVAAAEYVFTAQAGSGGSIIIFARK